MAIGIFHEWSTCIAQHFHVRPFRILSLVKPTTYGSATIEDFVVKPSDMFNEHIHTLGYDTYTKKQKKGFLATLPRIWL